jgi:hypothetical protein
MLKRYIKKDVKMPCKQVSLSIRAPLGNLEGICLLGLFERNGQYIWVPFLDPERIKSVVWRPSGTLVKGLGSTGLISDCGAQRA